ncbi:MAG: hypothetical protein HIU82_12010 [Proteobacteria bacterium]|nr:hypothetical protein [Pseudomonadota bacterium]
MIAGSERRFGRGEEIAATTLLLAGPNGGFYIGACLSPNGGDVMHQGSDADARSCRVG